MKIECPDCGEMIDTENEELEIFVEGADYDIICPCCGNEFSFSDDSEEE